MIQQLSRLIRTTCLQKQVFLPKFISKKYSTEAQNTTSIQNEPTEKFFVKLNKLTPEEKKADKKYRLLARFGPPLKNLVPNPNPKTVQAWLKSFTINEPLRIIDISSYVFTAPIRIDIVHRVVTYERNAMRQGTHFTRTISEVRGRAGKAFPQKGRGKARVGTIRAPHFRSGAIAHGPKPRSHATKIQAKVWKSGLRSALSSKFAHNQLVVVDSLALDSHKTGLCFKNLTANGWYDEAKKDVSSQILFLLDLKEPTPKDCPYKNLIIATKNIPGVTIKDVKNCLVYDILRYKHLIIDTKSLLYLTKRLSPIQTE
ncbi:hypothetical protein BB561_000269 [Smittium simulii]|uniref:Large ribosomal subunit protein uL4m n=1 Tax=Smittium simulii TaxID=133385 RepID=A0A2T9YZV6_9FUNG|nr:hypothetical protein BB561_000269 [Smittium simulii]